MNKKAFTLVELIVVVSLIAIVALIATPNIVNLVNSGKNEQVLADAKSFLTDVKYKSKLIDYENFYPTEGNCKEICLNETAFGDTIEADPDGNVYDKNKSCINVCKNGEINTYSITIVSINGANKYVRGVSSSKTGPAYVSETDLNIESVVKFK